MLSSISYVQLCATLWTVACQTHLPMGSSKARILEWVAMPSSRGSSQSREGTRGSPVSSASKADSLPVSQQGSPYKV